LSLSATFNENLQLDHTFSPEILPDWNWHVALCRNQLTRQTLALLPSILDETEAAFSEMLTDFSSHAAPFQSIYLKEDLIKLTIRVTNRIFVGLPLCRNGHYLNALAGLPDSVFTAGLCLSSFPSCLKKIAYKLMALTSLGPSGALQYLFFQVARRFREGLLQEDEGGSQLPTLGSAAPIVQGAPSSIRAKKSPEDIAMRIVLLTLPATQAMSIVLTMALVQLGSDPAVSKSLRRELKRVLPGDRSAWTHESLSNCRELDSFLKETLRLWAPNGTSLNRRVLKEFTLSNGISLPPGTFVACPSDSLHRDPTVWGKDAGQFSPSRFLGDDSSTERVDLEALPQPMHTTSSTYLTFGHGKHSCPGRYLSAIILKAILAYMILDFDIASPEVKDPKGVPKAESSFFWINGEHRVVKSGLKLLLRKRHFFCG